MAERSKVLNVRISEAEVRKLADLAADLGVSQSTLVRLWIRNEHEKRFGRAPAKPRKR